MRWNLLEKIDSIEKGNRAIALAKVPDGPYSPEILFVEMMAQTGALLVGVEKNFEDDLIFAKIEKAITVFIPAKGADLKIESWGDMLRPEGGWLDGKIISSGEHVAEARFLLMNVGELIPNHGKSITFHKAFMDHYNVLEKVTKNS